MYQTLKENTSLMELFSIIILELLNLQKKQLSKICINKQFVKPKHFKPILQ